MVTSSVDVMEGDAAPVPVVCAANVVTSCAVVTDVREMILPVVTRFVSLVDMEDGVVGGAESERIGTK